jgi:hypothetical protein
MLGFLSFCCHCIDSCNLNIVTLVLSDCDCLGQVKSLAACNSLSSLHIERRAA